MTQFIKEPLSKEKVELSDLIACAEFIRSEKNVFIIKLDG
jgi:hypothetical protein